MEEVARTRNIHSLPPGERHDGEMEVLAFPGSSFSLVLSVSLALHIYCYLPILLGFSFTPPQGLKIPGLGWNCQFLGQCPALLAGNECGESNPKVSGVCGPAL